VIEERGKMVARYLQIFWQLFRVGGLVAPVFVVVYFLSGSRADLEWFLWGGIAGIVGLAIFPVVLMYLWSKSAARTEFLEQQGVLALAEVVGLTETYAAIRDDNDYPMMKLDLHISGANLTPFNARKRVQPSTETQQSIITGRKLVVLVDPTDNSYQIDWQRSALIAGVGRSRGLQPTPARGSRR
jgi:hypothetical protein